MNPLLAPFNTPYETAPFHEIQLEHYEPAFLEAIQKAEQEINAITANSEPANFKNTIEALDQSGYLLDRISSIFFNLNSAETSEVLQALAQKVSPLLTNHSNNILLNEALFARVKHVFDSTKKESLTTEQYTLLENTYKSFARNGALLNDEQKNELRAINTELSKLSLTFGEHVLAETNDYQLEITNEADLAGLPASSIEEAKQLAIDSNKPDSWIITLQYPSYIPFVTYAQNRELRKELFLAFGSKAFKNNDRNNTSIIQQIVELRYKKAQLLGFENFAEFVLSERMAGSYTKVHSFLNELLEKALPQAELEAKELAEFAKATDGIEQIERWDLAYYAEKLKMQKYEVSDEQLKPYFQLEKVIQGVFKVAELLYGLEFKPRTDIPVYHKDVQTYEVVNKAGDFIAVFYADFFPRAGKRGGAWMTSFKDQFMVGPKNSRPHISIVCNFTKPTASLPSLLTFNEVTTLFHEFGHALHGMLSQCTYRSLSGTSVKWDFVELPSQILENWCYEKECLDLFAEHYETGEKIPSELIDKIKASANFREGYQTMRQLSFGLLDLAWHSLTDFTGIEVNAFEQKAMQQAEIYPKHPETNMSCAFSHIFQGGYAAGYYSYKWAEVLDADAFAYFKEHGIFNTIIANKFRENILEKGGSENPMDLYVKFRGQEPSVDALLERAGLVKTTN